ncbi:MAG: HAMP domain-containing histidine kinase [Candidatus Hydrogenedentes bacterium]|nr:HAMP domain-containing histidine kinase [Candidatus Hydrogenedentota bacterium]
MSSCEEIPGPAHTIEDTARLAMLFRYAQVGRCVNGIAHDINNFLGAIMAYSELVALEPGLGDEAQRMLNEILNSATKCSELVSAITTIARRDSVNYAITDVRQLLLNTVKLRSYAFRVGQLQVETELEEGLPSLVADAARLKMAFIHIICNAEEALEAQAERRMKIHLSNLGSACRIGIWNYGPPISADTQQRMFEQFYTEKPAPHIGLGLSVAQEIVRAHEGELQYDPERGFVIELPWRTALEPRL